MKPANIVRIVLYSAWSCFAIWFGASHPDFGELCTFVLICSALVIGEAWAARPTHPNRAAALATVVLICTIALRCTARLLKWESFARAGESRHELIARHFRQAPR